jgi:uncharacterized iron-regulated membrane protein
MGGWNVSLTTIVSLSILLFVGSIILAWWIVVRMPVDYLTKSQTPELSSGARHPVIRAGLKIMKNMVGLLFLVLGLVMLFTPGQGILFIFLGTAFMDFPGKQKLVLSLLGRGGVFKSLNKIREKSGRPPLENPNS